MATALTSLIETVHSHVVSDGHILIYILVYYFLNRYVFTLFEPDVFCSDNPGLYSVVHLSPKTPAYDLLSRMLE